MAITAALVKELRERTGAGMMDCKKALVETNADLEAAIDLMRASGAAKAAKKAGRIYSPRLFGCFCSTRGSHKIYGCFKISISFYQCLLAVHHSCTSSFT